MPARKFNEEAFRTALEGSISIREILIKLGAAPMGGNYKMFYRAAEAFKIDVSGFKKAGWGESKDILITNIDDETFKTAISQSISYEGTLKKLGFSITNGMPGRWVRRKIKELSLDISHFLGQGHLKGKTHNWNKKTPLKDLLVENSSIVSNGNLKRRLIKEGVLEEKCSICGILEWQGQKLSLHLDHISGKNTDYRIENLRFLCPNCHSLTATYCRGEKGLLPKPPKIKPLKKPKVAKVPEYKICPHCNINVVKGKENTFCRACYNINRAKLQTPYNHEMKIEWPSIKELKKRLETTPYTTLAKELGVSDNAIRKHIEHHSK